MRQIILFLFFWVGFIHRSVGQRTTDKTPNRIVMDASTGLAMLKQCSRAIPRHVSSFWTASQTDIADLENNFSKIDSLFAAECCGAGEKIKSPKNSALQCVGVVIKKRKYIYINAFPADELKSYNQDFDPTKTPVIVCDGGGYFWGVLFDFETKSFSLLSFNGYA